MDHCCLEKNDLRIWQIVPGKYNFIDGLQVDGIQWKGLVQIQRVLRDSC